VSRDMLRRAATRCFRHGRKGAEEPAWTATQRAFIQSSRLLVLEKEETLAFAQGAESVMEEPTNGIMGAASLKTGSDGGECHRLRVLTSTWLGEKRAEDIGFQPGEY
jgi:hypothetical protein